MLHLSFAIQGEKQLVRRLQTVATDIKDWGTEMKKTGKYLKETFSGPVFSSEGAEIGEPWVDGPYYHGLVRTGKMKKSFVFTSNDYMMSIGNTTSYFKYHQSKGARSKLPRRVMMKLDEKRKEAIVKIFQKKIHKSLK